MSTPAGWPGSPARGFMRTGRSASTWRPPGAVPRPPAGAVRPAVARHRLPPEHRRRAGRGRARHPGQADRRLPRAVRRRAGAGAALGGRAMSCWWAAGPAGSSCCCRSSTGCARKPEDLRFTLVAGSADILPGFPPAFRARFRAVLAAAGHRGEGRRPGGRGRAGRRRAGVRHAASRPTRSSGPPRPRPRPGSPAPGCRWTARDSSSVDASLRATDEVFAAGDMIAFRPGAIPRSGVYAVRAGPVLADNIRAALTGRPLRPYRPQADAMAIVSTGGRTPS